LGETSVSHGSGTMQEDAASRLDAVLGGAIRAEKPKSARFGSKFGSNGHLAAADD